MNMKATTFLTLALCGGFLAAADTSTNASRVPEPRPVKGPIEVHAFYYPGTEQMAEWDQVEQTLPGIKPLLGWYDEGNPEVVDWQIKWAAEHGISAFCVDWYWNRGDQRLNHWVDAYYKARHRRHLKWYMMYANHNEPGAHSTEDQIRVTRYWIDHFFKTPEYYTIDGKPVVVYWAFDSLDGDFRTEMQLKGMKPKAGDGVKYALELSDRMAREAGLPGIYFIDMYHGWDYAQGRVDRARNAGYRAQMIYNFDVMSRHLAPEAVRPGDTGSIFSYDAVVAAAPKWWEKTSRDPSFPLWPLIPTGWNDIPRSFEQSLVIYGRSVDKFRKVCADCRAFCEKKGFKRVIIAPLNEWQEGSYIEPNEEFGFGMYDAIRDVFCEKPAEGWPKNILPKDVGCGPYDYPAMPRLARTAWDFDDGTVQGWYRNPYGTAYLRNHDGKLWFFRSFRKNAPAIRTRLAPFAAKDFRGFRVKMRLQPGKGAQPTGKEKLTLWWGTDKTPVFSTDGVKPGPGGVTRPAITRTNRASMPVTVDGEWHEYTLDLSGHPGWTGQVDEVWFDPTELMFTDVLIDGMSFIPRGGGVGSLWSDFAAPPDSARPWCYWWWINGHADRETITADLEAMKELGFGGVLMFDSRGYHDDDTHVINPKAEIVWGSPEWYDRVEFAIRECARLGLEFTMNASASGGTLNGFIDGKEYETDVMNRDEVVAHLDRAVGPLLKRVPDLVGKTFTHIYSVSYEGNVKTGGSWKTIKDTFYATMRKWAHEHGLKVYSESGGPWGWGATGTKLDCDQLDMLAHNDFPQGEFWPVFENGARKATGHANQNGRFFIRAAVLSARREGRSIASLESFTHMHRHWTADPAYLKPLADIAFADGVNRLVWHTFTCSPKKFGVPGAEYFAGSHINRNVTWHKDAAAFVKYLGRCQALLQRGQPVDDGEFVNVTTNYHGWGRYRKDENAQFTTTHRREGDVDFFFVAGEGKGDVTLNASCEGRTVEIWDAVTGTRKELVGASSCTASAGGSRSCATATRVTLNLPVGGSCFVVFALPMEAIPFTNAWQVSFAYHPGVKAAPPAPMTMETLRDWTTFGENGKAASTELRYFSGTATYRTKVTVGSCVPHDRGRAGRASLPVRLSLGKVPTGLAHVFVNGKDCGVAWCAPWEVDISQAVRTGENEIEIRYTNNWANRLVGDCFLDAKDRVTASNLQYSRVPRTGSGWKQKPTRYAGMAVSDALQPSGLLGPVVIKWN